jgi:hypothetical protein
MRKTGNRLVTARRARYTRALRCPIASIRNLPTFALRAEGTRGLHFGGASASRCKAGQESSIERVHRRDGGRVALILGGGIAFLGRQSSEVAVLPGDVPIQSRRDGDGRFHAESQHVAAIHHQLDAVDVRGCIGSQERMIKGRT